MKIGSISESLEDYLEIIYELIQENKVARVKEIALRRSVSMSSVTHALKRLSKAGLIKYSSRSLVTLTETGTELAAHIVNRHQFVREFLMSIFHVPGEIAERDACIFEHYMSPETFRKFVLFFEFVQTCGMNIVKRFDDYCRNIASLPEGEICPEPTCRFRGKSFGNRYRHRGMVTTLSGLQPGQKGRVARVQASAAIRQRLIDMGVLPNVEIEMERVAPFGDPIEVKLRGYHLSLRKDEADAIILYPSSNGRRRRGGND